MRLTVDEKADALYFRLDESPVFASEEVRPGVILDFNDRGQVVGVEILDLRGRVPSGELRSLHFSSS